MATSLGGLVGCNEFIGPVERAANTTTTIDVVGEPTDPTVDLTKTADILASESTVPNAAASFGISVPESNHDSTDGETTTNGSTEPDVLGNVETEKPDRLKTSGRDAGKKPF